jgi:hypothetical protein
MDIIEFQYGPIHGNGLRTTCKFSVQGYAALLSERSGKSVRPTGLPWTEANIIPINRLAISVTNDSGVETRLEVGVQPVASDSAPDLGRGCIVEPVINTTQVVGWLDECRRNHGAGCKPSTYEPGEGVAIRVIDIQDQSLVELSTGCNYAALSYVWGGPQQIRLLTGNIKTFQQPGGLKQIWRQLPKTISDALEFTKLVGYRFLWVDSLCIVQDDGVDLTAQIPNMHLVYGCASVTIVAAAGQDANSGLPGIRGREREAFPTLVAEGVPDLVAGLPAFAPTIFNSVWETRGWTFQEKILSKRLIFFTKYQLFYHCNSATWCEDAVWVNRDPKIQMNVAQSQLNPYYQNVPLPSPNFAGLRKFFHLVGGYHARKLTKESDSLDAFSGALSSLSTELATSFCWGIPVVYIREALLWTTAIHDPRLRRPGFPSWSWVGWRATPLPGDLDSRTLMRHHVKTVSSIRYHQPGASGSLEELEASKSPESLPNEPPLETEVRSTLDKMANPRQALCFWADTVRLSILGEAGPGDGNRSFEEYGSINYDFGFVDLEGEKRPCGRLALSKDWVQSLSGQLEFEFIVLGVSTFKSLYDEATSFDRLNLLMVQTAEGISSRLQLTSVEREWLPWFRTERQAVVLA